MAKLKFLLILEEINMDSVEPDRKEPDINKLKLFYVEFNAFIKILTFIHRCADCSGHRTIWKLVSCVQYTKYIRGVLFFINKGEGGYEK